MNTLHLTNKTKTVWSDTAKDLEDAKAKLRDIKLSIVELQESSNNKATAFDYKFQGFNTETKSKVQSKPKTKLVLLEL